MVTTYNQYAMEGVYPQWMLQGTHFGSLIHHSSLRAGCDYTASSPSSSIFVHASIDVSNSSVRICFSIMYLYTLLKLINVPYFTGLPYFIKNSTSRITTNTSPSRTARVRMYGILLLLVVVTVATAISLLT